MVFHKCLFCTEGPQIKENMMTRKKKTIDEANAQMLRGKQRTETVGPSKGKKAMLSKERPNTVIKNSSSKNNVPSNVPNSQTSRPRKRKSETAAVNKDKKLKVSQKNQKEMVKKTFCWICRKPCLSLMCACGRVYHNECLIKTSKAFDGIICPECQLKSVDGTELSRPFVQGLKVYLECTVKWIIEKYKNEVFMSWPQNPGNDKIVPDIDIETLMNKVQNNAYKRTSEFYSDSKWIHHSTCILYGEKSKEAIESRKLIKDVKEELLDMEACPECYYYLYCKLFDDTEDYYVDFDSAKNLNYEKSFVRLCNPPHDIVWAKVSGYSHWPAKCLKVINGRAHVRFFGKHEKSDIPIDTIFHISKMHPVYEYRNITDTETRTSLEYTYAKREVLRYKALYEKNVGEFKFYGFREFYKTENDYITTEKNVEHQIEITERSQLELSSSTNIASGPCISEATTVTVEHPETVLPNHLSNDISVNMTFSIDGCGVTENADNCDTTSTNVTSHTNFSEQRLSEPNSNSSSISTGATSEIQVKEEVNDLEQIQLISSETGPTNEASSHLMQFLRNTLNNPSESFDFRRNGQTSNLLASILHKCISLTSTDEFSIPAMPLPNTVSVKEEGNMCPTNSRPSDARSSPSQMQELGERNVANVSECASVIVDNDHQSGAGKAVSCSTNKEIAIIDLTSDDDDIDISSSTLSNILLENPQICMLFQNAHQTLHSLLTRLCVETCKQQRITTRRRYEAFNIKLNETERRFHQETEKLRDEVKSLQRSLASEKKKNTES